MHLNNDDDMTIYDADSNVIYEAPITKDAIIKRELMGDFYVQLSFSHTSILSLPMGSHIFYEGLRFDVLDVVVPEMRKGSGGYDYNIKFYGQQHRLKNRRLRWLSSSRNEMSFSLTTDIGSFAKLVVDNMVGLRNVWRVGRLPQTNDVKNIMFDKLSCWDAVEEIAKAFDVEWWVTDVGKRVVYLNFGKLEIGDYEEFKVGDVLSSYEPVKGDNSGYGTRFYIFGGSRNIPSDYYDSKQGGVTNHISEKRLHLPNGVEYIDSREGLTEDEVIERVAYFDDVYPKNTETVTAVTTATRTINGEQRLAYIVECANSNFDHTVEDNIVDAEIGATFTSGSLNGREFKLKYDKRTLTKKYEIVAVTESAGGDDVVVIPNEYLHPVVGDTFVLTGVKLPEANITRAEQELLTKGVEHVAKNSANTSIYRCQTNGVYCSRNNKDYDIGQRVKLVGSDFGEDGRVSRVQGYEKRIFNPHVAIYNVGDNKRYSKFAEIVDKINSIAADVDTTFSALTTSNSNSIQKVEDISYTLASDRQLYIAEGRTISSEFNSIDVDFNTFLAQWTPYTDPNGDEYITANNEVYEVRVDDAIWNRYTSAYTAYKAELQAVKASTGVVEITDTFTSAQEEYYASRAAMLKAVSGGQDKRISDLDYLKNVFGSEKIANYDGVTLSSVVGVKDVSNNIVAGMYGGAVDVLNSAGYKDAEHGTLMIYAGATSIQDGGNAKYRVYEDGRVYAKDLVAEGTIYAHDGVFSGIVKHKVVEINSDNFDDLLPSGTNNYRTIPIDQLSAIVKFNYGEGGMINVALPSLLDGALYDYGNESISIDELRGLVGARFILYNYTYNNPTTIQFCGPKYDADKGQFVFVCTTDWSVNPSYFAIAECKIDVNLNGKELIYWDIKVGEI